MEIASTSCQLVLESHTTVMDLGSPTTTHLDVPLRSKRGVRHINILSFTRKLRVFWIIYCHITRSASAGGVGLAL